MEIQTFLQGKIDEVGLNIELTDPCALWTVEYRKGGWQKAHRHSDQTVKKISAVCYPQDPIVMNRFLLVLHLHFCTTV